MPESVTAAEFARRANVNRSTVSRWLKSGRITASPDGRIDPQSAAAQRVLSESPMPHHQARKAQIDELKSAQQAATPGATDIEAAASLQGANAALKQETLKLQRAKAEKAALEVDQLAGKLLDRQDVDFVIDDIGNTLRGLLESLADRYTGSISAVCGDSAAIHKVLEDAGHDIATEIAELMARRAGELGG